MPRYEVDDLYGSVYLGAADPLFEDGKQSRAFVVGHERRTFKDSKTGDSKDRVVLTLERNGRELKPMVVNKTVYIALSTKWGKHPEQWLDKELMLFTVDTPLGAGVRARPLSPGDAGREEPMEDEREERPASKRRVGGVYGDDGQMDPDYAERRAERIRRAQASQARSARD